MVCQNWAAAHGQDAPRYRDLAALTAYGSRCSCGIGLRPQPLTRCCSGFCHPVVTAGDVPPPQLSLHQKGHTSLTTSSMSQVFMFRTSNCMDRFKSREQAHTKPLDVSFSRSRHPSGTAYVHDCRPNRGKKIKIWSVAPQKRTYVTIECRRVQDNITGRRRTGVDSVRSVVSR